MNIYDKIAKAVEEGLRAVISDTIYNSSMKDPRHIYKNIDFERLFIIFGMEECPVDNAELGQLRMPVYNWYMLLNRPLEGTLVTIHSDMFTITLVSETGTFILNGREERDVHEEEALNVLLPRIIKRLREDELVHVLESLSGMLPEHEAIQETVKEWRLYHAYCRI